MTGLRPADFWALTPAEWRALQGEAGAPTRAEADALAQLYPDTEEHHD